jgi:hypothetical protein
LRSYVINYYSFHVDELQPLWPCSFTVKRAVWSTSVVLASRYRYPHVSIIYGGGVVEPFT